MQKIKAETRDGDTSPRASPIGGSMGLMMAAFPSFQFPKY